MVQTICFDQSTFFIGIAILIAAFIVYMKFNPITKMRQKEEKQQEHTPKETITTEVKQERPNIDPLTNRDYRVLNDPLIEPTKRVPRHVVPIPIMDDINFQTRGFVDNYQYVGNLIRASDEKIIKLMGRQKYPGSTKFEYFGLMENNGVITKTAIDVTGDNEVQDGDNITVSLFPSNNVFKFHKNKDSVLKYDPYY